MSAIETNRAKLIRRLESEGWKFDRHGSGHDIYRHAGLGRLIVPRHGELSIGVARSIAKKAGWVRSER